LLGGDDKRGAFLDGGDHHGGRRKRLMEHPEITPRADANRDDLLTRKIVAGTDKIDVQKPPPPPSPTPSTGGGRGQIDVRNFLRDAVTVTSPATTFHPAIAKNRMIKLHPAPPPGSSISLPIRRTRPTGKTRKIATGSFNVHDVFRGAGKLASSSYPGVVFDERDVGNHGRPRCQ